MKKYIYLAGPVTGHLEKDAKQWRDTVKALLLPGIIGINPLRGEGSPSGERYLPTDKSKLRNSKAIAAKNYYDTNNCDLVLAYLPKSYNAVRTSYGTIFELGWATGSQTPTILVTDDPTLTEHPLIDAKVNWVVETLEDAAEIINTLFGEYVE